MKHISQFIYESQYDDELPLTPASVWDEGTSMIEYPVEGDKIDELIKRINSLGTVRYKCEDTAADVEANSGLDHADFVKSYWCAVIDPESYDNEVIIVSIDDLTFEPEDEKLYKQYRS